MCVKLVVQMSKVIVDAVSNVGTPHHLILKKTYNSIIISLH